MFYVDASQAASISSRTCITYPGINYKMHVDLFKSGLCNCGPSKIDDYGKYVWENSFT